jgi:hypothetical protein
LKKRDNREIGGQKLSDHRNIDRCPIDHCATDLDQSDSAERKDDGSCDTGTEPDTTFSSYRLLPFWLSQYLWLLILLIFFLCGLFYVEHRDVVTVSSASRVFNFSSNPVYFAVLADPHIEDTTNREAQRYVRALEFARDMSVDTVIIVGDLVNNWGGKRISKYGNQFVNEFNAFRHLTKPFPFKYFFDLPGNHDEFGLSSYDSPRHYYKGSTLTNYSNDEDEFRIFTIETPDFAFIFMNPFDFILLGTPS